MTETIDTVCLDLDDTLCQYSRCGGDVLEEAFADIGVQPVFSIEQYYDRYNEYLAKSDGIEALRRQCFADLATSAGHEAELGRAVADAFSRKREQVPIDPCPGAERTLEWLESTYELALVTNGSPETQRSKLEAIDATDVFDTVVFAGYDTEPKPSPEPFEVALEALGTRPETAVHVGNSLRSDVAGARAAGVGTVWIPADGETETPPSAPTPDYVLDSLEALQTPPWLESGSGRPEAALESRSSRLE